FAWLLQTKQDRAGNRENSPHLRESSLLLLSRNHCNSFSAFKLGISQAFSTPLTPRRGREAIPLGKEQNGRQCQGNAQSKKYWVPDFMPLAEQLSDPTRQRHANDLSNGPETIDDAAGRGSAFLCAKIDRGGARDQGIGDVD